MARTGSSKTRTVTLANGDRVTVTTRTNRGRHSKTVTVKRPDGTSETQTFRKGGGLFGTGLFDIAQPYKDDVPGWAAGGRTGSRRLQTSNSGVPLTFSEKLQAQLRDERK